MKSSGRMKLFMSIGLAVLLIFQLILFLALKPGSLNSVLIIFGLIAFLAVLVVFLNFINLKKVENRVKNLPKDYQNFYVDANEAIGLSTMKRSSKKDTMDMILEILEHANQNHRALSEVIGHDANSYINGFISASGGAMTPLYLFGYSIVSFVVYLLLIKAYKVFRFGDGTMLDIRTQTLDVGIVLTYALIAFVFLPWLLTAMQKAAKNQWVGFKRLLVVLPLIIPLGIMAMLIFIDHPGLRHFLDMPLPIFSNIWLIFIGILTAVGGFILSVYARKRELRKTMNL